MKSCILFVLAFLVTCLLGVDQGNLCVQISEAHFSQEKASRLSEQALELETKILKQKYCESPDPDLGSLRLVLLLRYTNVGRERIILYRDSKFVSRIMISKTREDALSGQFEHDIHITIMSSPDNTVYNEKKPPARDFVTLSPGELYETVTVEAIPIPRDEPISDIITPGPHYFQMTVWTWLGSQKEAEQYSKKWKNEGKLWFNTTISEPMDLTVKNRPILEEDCECQNSGISEEKVVDLTNAEVLATYNSIAPYKVVTLDLGCEWDIRYFFKDDQAKGDWPRYIVDKKTGEILHKQ